MSTSERDQENERALLSYREKPACKTNGDVGNTPTN
ncbi:uncharacterized protein METZ01_LOCUS344234, partial [marine metagenome]